MSRPIRRGILVVALVTLLAPYAMAGSEEDPEITDDADDQAVLGQAEGADAIGFAGSDLLAGWITGETADELHLFMSTSGTFADGTAGPYAYEFHLTFGGTEYQATLESGGSPTPGGVATAVSIDGGTADFTVPKANIGSPAAGDLLTNLFMTAHGGGPEQIPGGLFRDRAPDADFGRDYTLTGGSAAPTGPTYENITTPTVSVSATFTTPTTAVFVYNWTNTFAAVNITHDANVTAGSVAYTITDSEGNVVEDLDLTASDANSTIVDPAALGNWTIRVVYTDFQGSFALSLEGVAGAPPPSSSGPPTTSGGPTTSGIPSETGGTGDGDAGTSSGFLDKLKGDPGYVILSTVCMAAVVAVGLIGRLVRWIA